MKMNSVVRSMSLLMLAANAGAISAQDPAVVDPSAAGLAAQRLEQMEKSIRAGEFKRVSSVLLSRDGKLAFERCFDTDGVEGLAQYALCDEKHHRHASRHRG